MNATQEQYRTSLEYERALDILRRMLETAVARAEHGEARPIDAEDLKRRLRERLARRSRAE